MSTTTDREPGADGGRHRLLDQVRLPGARAQTGLLDGPLLDAGDPGRDADDDPGVGPAVLVDLLDEVPEHLLGHLEVRDHAVLQRADGLDRAGGTSEHPLGLDPDRVHFAGAGIDRHHARLRQHNAAAADVDQRVCGP
jgi:hypothetical protein